MKYHFDAHTPTNPFLRAEELLTKCLKVLKGNYNSELQRDIDAGKICHEVQDYLDERQNINSWTR